MLEGQIKELLERTTIALGYLEPNIRRSIMPHQALSGDGCGRQSVRCSSADSHVFCFNGLDQSNGRF